MNKTYLKKYRTQLVEMTTKSKSSSEAEDEVEEVLTPS